MKKKITVIGSLNYDIILKTPRLPYQGETLPVRTASFSAGGKGANQAVQAAKLGTKTYMVGCVGTDTLGDFLIRMSEDFGVNTTHVRRAEGISGMGIVQALEDGSVYASIVRGANFAVTKEDIDHAVPLLQETGIVILQLEIPLEVVQYAIDQAKIAGCKVLLNAAPALQVPEEYLKKIDILVVNEVEASFYTGTVIDSVDRAKEEIIRLSDRYGIDCIFTLGKSGAVVSENGIVTFVPAIEVEAVETTGAGDSYVGAISHALFENQTLTDACAFATRCSAITVCRYGAQPAMPGLEEIK